MAEEGSAADRTTMDNNSLTDKPDMSFLVKKHQQGFNLI
jgi:hypothetical protein